MHKNKKVKRNKKKLLNIKKCKHEEQHTKKTRTH